MGGYDPDRDVPAIALELLYERALRKKAEERVAELEAKVRAYGHAVQQAKIKAQEARTVQAVLDETADALGVPRVNWDGSIPAAATALRVRVAALEAELKQMTELCAAYEDAARGEVECEDEDVTERREQPDDARRVRELQARRAAARGEEASDG